MPVIRLVEALDVLFAAAIEECASPDDTVTYDVSLVRDEGDEADGFVTMVRFYLSLDCPEIDGRTFTHITIPYNEVAGDTDFIRYLVRATWDRLVVGRMEESIISGP